MAPQEQREVPMGGDVTASEIRILQDMSAPFETCYELLRSFLQLSLPAHQNVLDDPSEL